MAGLARQKLNLVKVAVVDSGVDASHPALAGRILSAGAIAKGKWVQPARASKGQGYSNNNVNGHGTGVAGIICRIAPNARIHDIRVLGEGTIGKGEDLLAGFGQALETDARIINLSLAATSAFAVRLTELCEVACRRNRIVVAAKRNMPLEDNGFPAEISSCIGVDMADVPSPFILHYCARPPIEFAGQGVNVLTPAMGGGYKYRSATSFATPTITGLTALLIGRFPDLRFYEIKSLLKAFAWHVDSFDP